MWMRKKKPEVELTEDVFERWLRACRPPFTWFLQQPADVQERLAQIGTAHYQDLMVGVAYAIADPEMAGAPSEDSDEAAETMVRRVAADLASRIIETRKPVDRPPSLTMAGVVGRPRPAAPKPSRKFLGRSMR